MPTHQNVLLALFVMVLGSSAFAKAEDTVRCPKGQHWVRGHSRKSYIRVDGTFVSATKVIAHCRPSPPSSVFWSEKLKTGMPPGWKPRTEVSKGWTDEEVERVLEAIAALPGDLLAKSVGGIYRLRRSLIYDKNPAAGRADDIVLYDSAFASTQNLARILAHEFAHKLYRQLTGDEARSYNLAAEWKAVQIPGGVTVFVPMRESFVEDDGQEGPDEDFSNNIEYYLFKPESLKAQTPKVYEWIRKRYGDRFRITEESQR